MNAIIALLALFLSVPASAGLITCDQSKNKSNFAVKVVSGEFINIAALETGGSAYVWHSKEKLPYTLEIGKQIGSLNTRTFLIDASKQVTKSKRYRFKYSEAWNPNGQALKTCTVSVTKDTTSLNEVNELRDFRGEPAKKLFDLMAGMPVSSYKYSAFGMTLVMKKLTCDFKTSSDSEIANIDNAECKWTSELGYSGSQQDYNAINFVKFVLSKDLDLRIKGQSFSFEKLTCDMNTFATPTPDWSCQFE